MPPRTNTPAAEFPAHMLNEFARPCSTSESSGGVMFAGKKAVSISLSKDCLPIYTYTTQNACSHAHTRTPARRRAHPKACLHTLRTHPRTHARPRARTHARTQASTHAFVRMHARTHMHTQEARTQARTHAQLISRSPLNAHSSTRTHASTHTRTHTPKQYFFSCKYTQNN